VDDSGELEGGKEPQEKSGSFVPFRVEGSANGWASGPGSKRPRGPNLPRKKKEEVAKLLLGSFTGKWKSEGD